MFLEYKRPVNAAKALQAAYQPPSITVNRNRCKDWQVLLEHKLDVSAQRQANLAIVL